MLGVGSQLKMYLLPTRSTLEPDTRKAAAALELFSLPLPLKRRSIQQ
jgi:hypothetical protein